MKKLAVLREITNFSVMISLYRVWDMILMDKHLFHT